VAEIGPDGRSIEEKLVAVLADEAFRGKHRLAAVAVIFDRLGGRARQQVEVADITQEICANSSGEFRFSKRCSRNRDQERPRWTECFPISATSPPTLLTTGAASLGTDPFLPTAVLPLAGDGRLVVFPVPGLL